MKNKGNSFTGLLLLLFFMVAVPAFLVKEVTDAPSKGRNSGSVIERKTESSGFDGTYEFTSPVVDKSGVFSSRELSELRDFLSELNRTKGIQIGVLVVNSTRGEDIESFSMRHAEKWQLGQKGVDNGALLVVAVKDHKLRIETGYGTEGVLTDAKCARIIRNVIVPRFKSDSYSQGIMEGVKAMASVILSDESMVSEGTEALEERERGGTIPFPVILFIIIWVFMLFSAMVSSTRRRRHGGFFFVPPMGMGSHYHGHSGGFGGGSHGGFSGGGGSFGGGGASGSW